MEELKHWKRYDSVQGAIYTLKRLSPAKDMLQEYFALVAPVYSSKTKEKQIIFNAQNDKGFVPISIEELVELTEAIKKEFSPSEDN